MQQRPSSPGFADVDRTANAKGFVSYLDAVSAQNHVAEYKKRSIELLDLREGSQVLEVGCGTGEDAREIARRVRRPGGVVAIDKSDAMIEEARRRSAGLELTVRFVRGDVHSLDLPGDSFDACRADRVFQHLDDPRKALAEIIRVTKPGGRIAILDPDWETLVVFGGDRALTRKILNFHCDSVRNGWIGRELVPLFTAARLKRVGVEANTMMLADPGLADQLLGIKGAAFRAQQAGVISPADAARWLDSLEAAHRAEVFFCALTGFAVFGIK